MEIYLDPVEAAKKDVLFRLLQYSLFEESLTDQNSIGEDGWFAYPWFENYFTDNDREAFFIREKKSCRLLGFAMINAYMQKCTAGHSIAEFMVLPEFRRRKIGITAACLCFDRYPGNWEVSPAFGSHQAYLFWKNVICDYTGTDLEIEDGIFVFSNRIDKRDDYVCPYWE